MINLIPPKAKSAAVKEYWVRVLSVWGILFSIVAITTALFLLPTYVLIHSQLASLEKEVIQQNNVGEQFQVAEETVQMANRIAGELSEPHVQTPSHQIVTAINEAAADTVVPDTFRVARADREVESVSVQGVAASREALAAFKKALERSPLFETAVVPISDLARETDLPFAITIRMAPSRTE